MRLADYVIQFLEGMGVAHVFMLSGGGIMYLVDAVGRSRMEYVCCHHEQSAAIAAQSYAMVKNSLGVCLVTTGPGGTNALTAAGAAFMDSTPVFFLSGQVKTADAARLRHVRQYGAQENDIVSMAKPVTKYAAVVTEAETIRYHLEKAAFLAMHGRRGPVWLDIPLDIQNAQIQPECLAGYDEQEAQDHDILAEKRPDVNAAETVVDELFSSLLKARRPLFLIGHGVLAGNAQELFLKVAQKMQVPVMSTWRALGIMDSGDRLFFDSPGLQAKRYSNIMIQGADLLIVLGSRLDHMITAFNEEHFAFRAKKFIVDIDKNEIKKLAMLDVVPLVCSAVYFLEKIHERLKNVSLPNYEKWISFGTKLKERYPLSQEKQSYPTKQADLYYLAEQISEYCDNTDVLVASSTSRCNTAGHMAFRHTRGQRIVSSMGFGSMGFALPSVIGAWFASGMSRIIMLEGDGSFQLNLQELQTMVHYHINAKLFVFQNKGYAAISTMQDRNFNGFHVGCDEMSGVSMPDLEKISAAYGIMYYKIENNAEAAEGIRQVMNHKGLVICECIGSIRFDEIPKCISALNEDGNRVSAALENPYPFLPDIEMEKIYREESLI